MPVQAKSFQRTRFACFYTYLAMSSVFSFPPLLFVTFREMYGVSYTLLGTLVLINFCTQLGIDLIFTFFGKYFNIKTTIRIMPLLTCIGMATYAIVPNAFPQIAYAGLVIGTVIFSVAAGLCEVLLSPLIAALPSEHPDRDMSKLHSLYAYGVVTVVLVSTLYFWLFGRENWMYLGLFWAVLPIGSCVLYCVSPLPDMNISQNSATKSAKNTTKGLALCVLCIFLGSAAENAMTNWISGYVENALHISKAVGDILGLALFAILLGFTRTWYAKYGKNIGKTLLIGMAGAVVCYLVASFSSSPILSLAACVLTGVCTSMLWPGTLILMEENYPALGVTAYALMAAGGDFGASVAPQMLGVVVDTVSVSDWALALGTKLSLTAEQIGMKVGMLTASIFPILGVVVLIYSLRYFKKQATAKASSLQSDS